LASVLGLQVPPDERNWKIWKRKREVENESYSRDRLKARMVSQLHARGKSTRMQRRPSRARRGAVKLASARKQRAKGRKVFAAIQAIRAKAKAAG